MNRTALLFLTGNFRLSFSLHPLASASSIPGLFRYLRDSFALFTLPLVIIPSYPSSDTATHADYTFMYGEVPCVRCLTVEEIADAYEENTGHLIVNEFKCMEKEPIAVPAVLCKNHAPFVWGKDAKEAAHNAVVLEEMAKMAYRAETINSRIQPAPQELQGKHYDRKHGATAYYGQREQ